MQDEFPRKSKIGKLAMSSQKTYARFLMGYHERFNQLIFDETEKGWGTITPKGGLDWKSFWAKYPPKNKDPKNSEKEISVSESNWDKRICNPLRNHSATWPSSSTRTRSPSKSRLLHFSFLFLKYEKKAADYSKGTRRGPGD